MTFKQIHYIITVVLVTAVVILLWHGCNSRKRLKQTNAMYVAANDSLTYSKDSLTATISVITTEREKDFLNMETKDETIKKLQGVVKDYKGKLNAAAIVISEIIEKGATATTITENRVDTIINGDTVYIENHPTYATDWIEEWSIGEIIATEDTIYRQIWVKNEFEITIGKQRKYNPFKKKELEIQLKNNNPNAYVKDMRAYVLKVSDKRWGLSANAGYGMMLTFDGRVHHGVYAGIGVSWRIFP